MAGNPSAFPITMLGVRAYVSGTSHDIGGFTVREMHWFLPMRVFQPLASIESRIRRGPVEINDRHWYITCSLGVATQGCEGGED